MERAGGMGGGKTCFDGGCSGKSKKRGSMKKGLPNGGDKQEKKSGFPEGKKGASPLEILGKEKKRDLVVISYTKIKRENGPFIGVRLWKGGRSGIPEV